MQVHKACNPLNCPRKAAAFARLAEAGELVPAGRGPRERAARGIPYPPTENPPTPTDLPEAILRRLLTGLAEA